MSLLVVCVNLSFDYNLCKKLENIIKFTILVTTLRRDRGHRRVKPKYLVFITL